MSRPVTLTDGLGDHVDDSGAPCAHHVPASPARLLQLAMVGSRAPAFHHDCASKLQGLVMALDELSELTANADPQVAFAVDNALEASRELSALLNINRALTKPAPRQPISLRELVTRAAQRAALALSGELPDTPISVSVPPMTHALALVLDVAAGGGRARAIPVSAVAQGGGLQLTVAAPEAAPAHAGESLAIASFVVGRDGGRLWCRAGGAGICLWLAAS